MRTDEKEEKVKIKKMSKVRVYLITNAVQLVH